MEGRRRESFVAIAAFVAMGFDVAIGAAWPQAHGDIHAPVGLLGVVLALQAAAYLATTANTGTLVARLGFRPVIAGACAIAAAGLAAVAVAPNAPLLIAALVVLHAAVGPIDAGVNAHAAVHGGLRRLGWIHAAWGLGATLGPALVAASQLTTGSWRPAFGAFAIAMLAVALTVASTAWRPFGEQAAGSGDGGRFNWAWVGRASAFLVAAIGVEGAVGQWSATVLASRGLGTAAAASGAAAFFAGLTLGRAAIAVTPWLELRVVASVVVCGVATVVTAAMFWLLPPLPAAYLALPLIGVALAPMVPLLMLLTPRHVGARHTARAVGYQTAAGVGGGSLGPGVLGAAVQAFGAGVLAPSFAAGAVILASLSLLVRRAPR